MTRDAVEWSVAAVVVAAAGALALGAIAFFALPILDYCWSWWRLALG